MARNPFYIWESSELWNPTPNGMHEVMTNEMIKSLWASIPSIKVKPSCFTGKSTWVLLLTVTEWLCLKG